MSWKENVKEACEEAGGKVIESEPVKEPELDVVEPDDYDAAVTCISNVGGQSELTIKEEDGELNAELVRWRDEDALQPRVVVGELEDVDGLSFTSGELTVQKSGEDSRIGIKMPSSS